jgi:hypothetical protein
MIKIVRLTLLVSLLKFLALGATSAAPAPPFEWYLLRAETVFIGRIADRTDKDVSFEVIELLRGQGSEHLRRYVIDKEGFVLKESPTWLVISQGDNHFGKAETHHVTWPTIGWAKWLSWMDSVPHQRRW